MDCSPPGPSIHGISQARILGWVANSFSRGSSLPRDWTQVSCIVGRFFTVWATREAQFENIKITTNKKKIEEGLLEEAGDQDIRAEFLEQLSTAS